MNADRATARRLPSAIDRCEAPDWLSLTLEGLRYQGFAVLENVLSRGQVADLRDHMYAVQPQIVAAVGQERLDRAGERGVLRLMMKYDPFFLSLLELPEVLAIVDATVSPTAILHLQNGFILPPVSPGTPKEIFQTSYHRDFPRLLNGYMASVNVFVALDDFTTENGATLVVPGTHQQDPAPSAAYNRANAVPVTCPAGSLIVFDSTLVHAAGHNASNQDRLAINMQFTRSYIKQQIDYVRALGDDMVRAQPPRTQQLLGYYTRVVTSLDEYYRPAEERLYRGGQG
jgi:ectoine hydroxylase-related dioxygenase (phytanoyl-CoA dioxygenase family)